MAEGTQEAADDKYSWTIPMQVLIESVDHKEVHACSISIVPDRLRNPKEEAFKPREVSLGALTNGTWRNPQSSEQLKSYYTRSLLSRGDNHRRTKYFVAAMGDLDSVVRACYGGRIEIEPRDLAYIMFLDGCFVLEFLLRFQKYRQQRNSWQDDEPDPIFTNVERLNSVLNDLIILENQIPYFVLKNLYSGIFPSDLEMEDDHRVAKLALSALGLRYEQVRCYRIPHLLHLIHLSFVNPENNEVKAPCQELRCERCYCYRIAHLLHLSFVNPENNEVKVPCQELTRCATRLQEFGVSILAENSNPDDNSFLNKYNFHITFRAGILKIPPLHIKNTTETSWRNLIAWEQTRIGIKHKFNSYALFFHHLIRSEQDIELLLESNVIVNRSKMSNEDLLTMFRTIADGVKDMDLSYSELCEKLNNYRPAEPLKKLLRIMRPQRRNIVRTIRNIVRKMSMLWTERIPTWCKVVGALATLALTAAQTYYAVQNQN